ncbi:hypothetical protein [Roseibium aggregatum]|uniref:hypothetical protein n=1 Tax=Roseibium aggregatum TaxID=187304 RepID=UPI001AD90972|nr:hypothetical protein [Roseibium aggregatum]
MIGVSRLSHSPAKKVFNFSVSPGAICPLMVATHFNSASPPSAKSAALAEKVTLAKHASQQNNRRKTFMKSPSVFSRTKA